MNRAETTGSQSTFSAPNTAQIQTTLIWLARSASQIVELRTACKYALDEVEPMCENATTSMEIVAATSSQKINDLDRLMTVSTTRHSLTWANSTILAALHGRQ